MRAHGTAGRCGGALALLVSLCGCVPQGLAFRVDTRLTIVAPKDRSTVSLPVSLDWDIRDFTVVAPGQGSGRDEGYFAVVLDDSPMPPGKKVSWFARKDASCLAAEGCPDARYLADHGVYTATATELTLAKLPPASVTGGREHHRATIVLLDASGTRLGESAFHVTFQVARKGPS